MKDEIFTYNGKEFIFANRYMDEKYGEVLTAVTTKFSEFEVLYLKRENGNLIVITDEEIKKYIFETYEKTYGDVILPGDEIPY